MFSKQTIFKSPELETQYLEAYEEALGLWPVPHEAMDVPTSYGLTHINVSGSKDKPAMLLLPGFGANSTMWFPNIAALSSHFCVYALDTIGQPGRSIPTQGLRAENCANWMVEVMNGLELEKACVIGISLGGWIALRFSLHASERVSRVVLLDPASTFVGMSAAFLWHSLIPIMIAPTRGGLIRYFRWITQGYQTNRLWGELMIKGILHMRPQPPIRATVFSDEELCRLQVPVLLLIGERSVIYDPRQVLQRARGLIPHLEAEIIAEASHALNAEKADHVNARILDFCKE
jgi:pimeloyl-ACP methyl ester carboxylesterase